MTSLQVNPDSFRKDLLEQLGRYEFDLEKTKLRGFAKAIKADKSEYHTDSAYRLRVHVRASYPSCLTWFCYNLLPMLARTCTCCWCWCKLLWQRDPTFRELRDAPTGSREGRTESTEEHNSPVYGGELMGALGRSKDPATTGPISYTPPEGLWETRDKAIGASEWYSSWGGLDVPPVMSAVPNTINKRRPDKNGKDYFDPLDSELKVTPLGICNRLRCTQLRAKCGTPECCGECFMCCSVWALVGMSFPLIIAGFFWDVIGFPLFCILGMVFALLFFEPFGCIQSCACGMKSSRGAVLLATLQHRYTRRTYGTEDTHVIQCDEAIAQVVLAEHISVMKACFLEAGGTCPSMSRYQYLVRNPIWGLFELDIPAHEIAAAWTDLVKRVGGMRPQTDCSNDQWTNGDIP